MTIRDFLKLNLTEAQQQLVRQKCPELSADMDRRGFQDTDFAVRLIRAEEDALWLLWFLLHSVAFVRIIRMRSKYECGSPCNLVDFQQLPCLWSKRVLEAYFQAITLPGGRVLEAFSREFEGKQGLLDYLSIYLHETFHVEMLREHGYMPMDEIALPPALRSLFGKDERYRTIFVNRWLWGLTELGLIADAVRPELPRDTLMHWVEQVDDAILDSKDMELVHARLATMRKSRANSGIPSRTLPGGDGG